MSEETARERQSRVARAGNKWEEYVRLFLNEKLQGTGIEVIYGKNENEVKQYSITLWRLLRIPIKSPSTRQEYIWGDVDLVAVKEELPIAIISCKLSLHGRFTETLFWSLLYRLLTQVKVVLATPDAGRGGARWVSEWGTPESPTKDRLLAETFLDGVYVENVETWCKNMKPGEGTAFGGIVRPLDELPNDLLRWSTDTAKLATSKHRGLDELF